MRLAAVLTGALALLTSVTLASAAEITQTFNISAYDLVPYFGSTPIDPLDAAFTITYDPTVETYPTATDITVDSSNFPTLTPKFTYLPSGYLVIGTKPTTGGGANTNQGGDYYFAIDVPDSRLVSAQYIALNFSGEYYATAGSVSISSAPEPSMWLLLVMGTGLVGAALRHRQGSGVFPYRRKLAKR